MNGPSKASPIATGQLPSCLTSLCAVVLLAGLISASAAVGGPALFLSAREREIKDSTQGYRDRARRRTAREGVFIAGSRVFGKGPVQQAFKADLQR